MKRMACVLALAAGTGLLFSSVTPPAQAEPAPMPAASDLQVAIATPEVLTSEPTMMLDVNFRGGNLRSVELYVDGVLLKKQALRTRDGRGVISFALDGSLLTEGNHDLLVKAIDTQGNVASTTSKLRVVGEETNALVKFLAPKRRQTVQGVVPIELKLHSSIRNPYVTFLVDNEFLSFTNYAPFTYNWDSTRVSNGNHVIEVQVYDGDTLATVKNLSLPVTVNNSGGLTTRRTDYVAKVNALPSALAEAANPDVVLPLTNGETTLSRAAREVAAMKKPLPFLGGITSPDSRVTTSAPVKSAVQTLRPNVVSLLAEPQTKVVSPTTALVRQVTAPRSGGRVAVRPEMILNDSPVSIANGHSKPTAFAQNSLPAPKALVGLGALNSPTRSFEVAFDNTRIAFDVPPRIEQGLPLAPFRHIFEHTGGQVKWFGESKTVRAFNSLREVEFRIGQSEATVNNQVISLDRTPYLDRGRAIVPISFVREALDVLVNFDPKTGHLRIDSKK